MPVLVDPVLVDPGLVGAVGLASGVDARRHGRQHPVLRGVTMALGLVFIGLLYASSKPSWSDADGHFSLLAESVHKRRPSLAPAAGTAR